MSTNDRHDLGRLPESVSAACIHDSTLFQLSDIRLSEPAAVIISEPRYLQEISSAADSRGRSCFAHIRRSAQSHAGALIVLSSPIPDQHTTIKP